MIDKDDRQHAEHDRDKNIVGVLTAIEHEISGSLISTRIEDTITPLRLTTTKAVLAACAANDLAAQDADARLALLLGIRDFVTRKPVSAADASAIAAQIGRVGADLTAPPDRPHAEALRRVWLALVSDIRSATQGGS